MLSWRTPPPHTHIDGWLGRSAFTLTKRTCLWNENGVTNDSSRVPSTRRARSCVHEKGRTPSAEQKRVGLKIASWCFQSFSSRCGVFLQRLQFKCLWRSLHWDSQRQGLCTIVLCMFGQITSLPNTVARQLSAAAIICKMNHGRVNRKNKTRLGSFFPSL